MCVLDQPTLVLAGIGHDALTSSTQVNFDKLGPCTQWHRQDMLMKVNSAYRTIGTVANVAVSRALTGQMYRSVTFTHSPEQTDLRN